LTRCDAYCIPGSQSQRYLQAEVAHSPAISPSAPVIDRRQFIEAGLSGSIAAALARAVPVNVGSKASGPRPPERVALYDGRYFDCREFAVALQDHRACAHALLWSSADVRNTNVSLHWASKPVAIAGLIAHAPHFCLQRLALSRGMRVLYEGVHHPLPRGRVEHAISAPPQQSEWARSDWNLAHAASWATSIAELIARIGRLHAGAPGFTDQEAPFVRSAPLVRYVSRSHSPLRESGQPLHSWLIARVPNV
jgi:hypothetical protein